MQNKTIKKYYNQKFALSRNVFARVLDMIFITALLSLFVFIISYIIYSSFLPSVLITIFSTIAFTAVFLRIKKQRLSKFVEKQLSKANDDCLLEKLVLLSKENFRCMIKLFLEQNEYTDIKKIQEGFICTKDDKRYYVAYFQHHYTHKLSANEVLSCFRTCEKLGLSNLLIIPLSKPSNDAISFADKFPSSSIAIVSIDKITEFCKKNNLSPDESEIENFILLDIKSKAITSEKFRKEVLNRSKAKIYAVLGVFLMSWSYFSGFKIIYPIAALICFTLAFFSFKNKYHNL